jgi:UDP-N-acetylglucosamine acyltransferase
MTNRIHPTAVIGAGVELGEHNVVGPYSVLVGPCRIGDGNWIGPHVVVGTPAQERDAPHPVGWDGDAVGSAGRGVVLGDRNRVREFTAIHQGTARPTRIGDDCRLLSGCHVGHDADIADDVTLADGVRVGGGTDVWSYADLGLGAVVHPGARIGPGALVGMGAAVRGEVSAFVVAVGAPTRTVGVHEAALRRRGCDDRQVAELVPFLTGGGELLPQDLPVGITDALKRWADRLPLDG